MKKVFLVLAVVMLLTSAATMTMAATLAEWNYSLATFDPDLNRYAPTGGSLTDAITSPSFAPSVPPIDNTNSNWQQVAGASGEPGDYALGWYGRGDATFYARPADGFSRESTWFTETRKTLTVSLKVKFDMLRYRVSLLYPNDPFYLTTNQNNFLSVDIGLKSGLDYSLYTIVGSAFCNPNPNGGTNPAAVGSTNGSVSTYFEFNTAGINAATPATYATGSELNRTDWRNYAGIVIGQNDTTKSNIMSKFAERGSIGTALPFVAPDTDPVPMVAGEWYLYTMTIDYSAGNTATYKVYVGDKLQATLVQNLPTDLAAGDYFTVKVLRYGCRNSFRGYIDDFKISDTIDPPVVAPPAGAVTGTVNLQGWSGAKLGEAVALTITDASSNSETLNTTLDSNGGYSVTTTLRGTCYVSAKCSHWLSDGKEAVVDANGAAAVDFSMINGDCNNDNGVDEGDFGLLSSAWYSSDGDPNFDSRADLNGDGGVDEGDFGLLSAAWYQSGI